MNNYLHRGVGPEGLLHHDERNLSTIAKFLVEYVCGVGAGRLREERKR